MYRLITQTLLSDYVMCLWYDINQVTLMLMLILYMYTKIYVQIENMNKKICSHIMFMLILYTYTKCLFAHVHRWLHFNTTTFDIRYTCIMYVYMCVHIIFMLIRYTFSKCLFVHVRRRCYFPTYRADFCVHDFMYVRIEMWLY